MGIWALVGIKSNEFLRILAYSDRTGDFIGGAFVFSHSPETGNVRIREHPSPVRVQTYPTLCA